MSHITLSKLVSRQGQPGVYWFAAERQNGNSGQKGWTTPMMNIRLGIRQLALATAIVPWFLLASACHKNTTSQSGTSPQSTNQADTSSTPPKPEIYAPLTNRKQIGLDIVAEASTVTFSPLWDGYVEGKVTKLQVNGKDIELKSAKIDHDDNKSWIDTQDFGRFRIAGAYGTYTGSNPEGLGSMIRSYFPPNTMHVEYVMPDEGYPGICVWLRPSQLSKLSAYAGGQKQ